MAEVLRVADLRTVFHTRDGDVTAVRGVSFTLGAGEVLGIVGESGSGKSVTAMSIMRLLAANGRISGGEIWCDGKDLVASSEEQLRHVRGGVISMVFQDPMSSLNPLLTVGRQVSEMLETHTDLSPAEIRARVLELFQLVRIPEPHRRIDSYPHEFSGGMRQRVMIAMALACDPTVLIADEPTTALDVTIQDQILRILRQLQEEVGLSVIFITHDLGVVAELCDRVAVMYAGEIVEEGSLEEIFESPAHPYTRGLIASVPKIDGDRGVRLTSIPGSPPDLIDPPPGCAFAPRCEFARNICTQQPPKQYALSPSHSSRCHLLDSSAPESHNPFAELRGAHVSA